MKKNKKFYNFTDRQKKRDRSLKICEFYSIGAYSKKRASKKLRRANSRALYKIMIEGEEGVAMPIYRKYMWWDM
ncbi:MAG: hypothetical protein GY810_27130 [Aureispira sp.]|nr:hypothetical protein [Aureispira sp.]